ncbi:GH-E family nuclease [uncultured Tessaracoccus sp.]|uniref:GH-E family nuclease n=1 Tax=uncultured Tessaracoccus sp. TaxID=905023 RepID=UPI0025E13D10|nr:GH-E family nuclease [uncultured Tessaracoccus sp.]
MGKRTKAIGEGGARIAKQIGKKLNYGDFAGDTSKALAKATQETVQRVKRVSKRRKYLGRTPGKNSRTGREVIERMRAEGKIERRDDKDYLMWRNPETGDVEPVPLEKCDMAHHPVDAVTYWNETGIKHGPKSDEVRQWMLDSKNYELQPSSYNRSQGAKLGHKQQYKDPEG